METSYLGVPAKKMKPTKKHRPAIWESMLATVNARNSKGEIKYFDYNYDEAIKFAEIGEDVRVFRADRTLIYGENGRFTINKGRLVLWTK